MDSRALLALAIVAACDARMDDMSAPGSGNYIVSIGYAVSPNTMMIQMSGAVFVP